MSRSTMRLTGSESLLRNLRRVTDEATARGELVKASMAGAEPIRRVASERSPVDTGLLSRSIVVEAVTDRNLAFEGAGVFAAPGEGMGSRRTFYAHMQEFGTRHHAAQPFMRPAFDEQKATATRMVRDYLEASLVRALK